MKLKLLLSILFLASSFCISAQINETENYTKKELTSFAKIYKYTLDNPFDFANSMKDYVKKLHISEKRMTEILQAQFAGKKVKLSNEEIQQLEKLQAMMENDKKQHDKKVVKFMRDNKMELSKFKEIEEVFQSDVTFQLEVTKLSAKN